MKLDGESPMARPERLDLATWILVEAYKCGSAEREPRDSGDEAGVGGLTGYRISRRSIYRRYFGLEDGPGFAVPGAAAPAGAHCLARLKKAVLLARAVKRLLEQKLIDMLPVHSEYLYLTEYGVLEAESLLADISG
jgi:hypothetical protein